MKSAKLDNEKEYTENLKLVQKESNDLLDFRSMYDILDITRQTSAMQIGLLILDDNDAISENSFFKTIAKPESIEVETEMISNLNNLELSMKKFGELIINFNKFSNEKKIAMEINLLLMHEILHLHSLFKNIKNVSFSKEFFKISHNRLWESIERIEQVFSDNNLSPEEHCEKIDTKNPSEYSLQDIILTSAAFSLFTVKGITFALIPVKANVSFFRDSFFMLKKFADLFHKNDSIYYKTNNDVKHFKYHLKELAEYKGYKVVKNFLEDMHNIYIIAKDYGKIVEASYSDMLKHYSDMKEDYNSNLFKIALNLEIWPYVKKLQYLHNQSYFFKAVKCSEYIRLFHDEENLYQSVNNYQFSIMFIDYQQCLQTLISNCKDFDKALEQFKKSWLKQWDKSQQDNYLAIKQHLYTQYALNLHSCFFQVKQYQRILLNKKYSEKLKDFITPQEQESTLCNIKDLNNTLNSFIANNLTEYNNSIEVFLMQVIRFSQKHHKLYYSTMKVVNKNQELYGSSFMHSRDMVKIQKDLKNLKEAYTPLSQKIASYFQDSDLDNKFFSETYTKILEEWIEAVIGNAGFILKEFSKINIPVQKEKNSEELINRSLQEIVSELLKKMSQDQLKIKLARDNEKIKNKLLQAQQDSKYTKKEPLINKDNAIISQIKDSVKYNSKAIVKYGKGYNVISKDILEKFLDYENIILNQFQNKSNFKMLKSSAGVIEFSLKGPKVGDIRLYVSDVVKYEGKCIVNLFGKYVDHDNLSSIKANIHQQKRDITKEQYDDLIKYIQDQYEEAKESMDIIGLIPD